MWSLYICLLILGSSSGVHMETCPREEDIYPCKCEDDHTKGSNEIQVTCSDVSLNIDTLRESLSGLSGKNDVDLVLMDLQLGKLPADLFSGIGIKKLSIDYCFLDSLSADNQPALSGLENQLEELMIAGSFTEEKEPAKLNLGHMKKLKKVTLIYNSITELGDDWFSNGPSSLEVLEIFNNNIEKIGSNAFAQLDNLKLLTLGGNGFGPVKRSMFPASADKLEILELDNNGLTEIPKDIFSRMPSVHSVSLNRNAITTIEEHIWYPVWQQLGTVSLEGNNIYCDERIDWILKYKERPNVYGKCRNPEEFEGIELKEFFEKRSQ